MCGIAGALGFDGSPVRPAAIRAMTDALTHRGPDEGAVRMLSVGDRHRPPVVGLGHRRLRVVDLTPAAAQPMTDGAERGWLSYNGELYNAPELRAELRGRGVAFRSRSDTEVVLQALLTWGTEALPRFNGMFALAFWDALRNRLLLARDRFGEKPLYYAHRRDRLLFASELGALPCHGGLSLSLDDEAVEIYLALGYVPAPWSIYREVRKLPHGAFLLAEPGGTVRIERYYRLEERLERGAPSDPAQAVRAALAAAVGRRLQADVPLGAFLSGGIDSTAIVTLMGPMVSPPLHTYSMAVPELGYFDESSRARATSRRLGTEHHQIDIDARRLQEEIPTVFDRLDEPFADSSALATSIVAREARRDLTVALSGDGGDEIFGGYRLLRALSAHRLLRRLPARPRKLLAGMLRLLPSRHGGGAAGLVQKARKLLDGLTPELAAQHAAWIAICDRSARTLLRPGAADHGLAEGVIEERYRRFAGSGGARTLAVEVDLPLADDMLVKVDRTSMRHALEVRAPFLDPDLVEMALSLPESAHVSALSGKRLLRHALHGLVPEAILRAPKRGFEVPVGHWMTGPLAGLYRDVTDSRALRGLPGADPATAARWFAEHGARRADHGRALWALFAFCWWFRGPRARHARAAQFLDDSSSEVTVFRRSEG